MPLEGPFFTVWPENLWGENEAKAILFYCFILINIGDLSMGATIDVGEPSIERMRGYAF